MIAFLLGLLVAAFPADRMQAKVDAALTARDSFCVSLREGAPPLLFASADPIALGRMGVLLSNAEASRNPWFHLMRSLYEKRIGSGKDEVFVDNALFVARDDAATLAALALELQRQGEHVLASRAAAGANTAFRNAGGVRSVYLEGMWEDAAGRDTARSQEWRILAGQVSRAALDGGAVRAEGVLAWPASLLSGAWNRGWRAGLELFRQAWSLARCAGAWFLALAVLALGIRHLPAVLHPLRELLGFLPERVRLVVSWLPLLGLLAAGWAVVCWAVLLATASRWRSPAERWGGVLAATLLAMVPLDALVGGVFLDIDTRTGNLGTVVAALDGEDFQDDTLVAGAVSHARMGNSAQALHRLQAGRELLATGWPQDLEGWLLRSGNDGRARDILETAWLRDRNPWSGLALGKDVDTTLELRRQIELGRGPLVPEPTPGQFLGMFVHGLGSGAYREVWMPRSLVPLPFFGWAGLFFLAVVVALGLSSSRNGQAIEPCAVCGRTTCPRCRSSALCPGCRARLAQATDANSRRRLRLEMVSHRIKARRDFGNVADTFLPGWGGLVSAPGPAWGTLGILGATSLVLGAASHAVLWIGDVEGMPSLRFRLLGCLPLVLWVGVLMPLRRGVLSRGRG